jgi:hypothetical protein
MPRVTLKVVNVKNHIQPDPAVHTLTPQSKGLGKRLSGQQSTPFFCDSSAAE